MAKSNRNYITRAGYTRLEKELRYLWQEQRPQVTQAVSEAAAQGDRSENAEYIYGKKQLRAIDRRIRFLSRRLDALQVVDQPPADPKRAYFGAWVDLETEVGERQRYRLVGPDEIDVEQGWVSINAPLARALLGKRVGDEFFVTTPNGEVNYFIIAIVYSFD